MGLRGSGLILFADDMQITFCPIGFFWPGSPACARAVWILVAAELDH